MKLEIVQRNQQNKGKTKGCLACGSSIAVACIKTFECPACGSDTFLATIGDQDKIRSREERLGNARKDLVANEAKLVEAARTALLDSVEFRKVWVVFEQEVAPELEGQACEECEQCEECLDCADCAGPSEEEAAPVAVEIAQE